MNLSLLKKPSGYLPIALALAALTLPYLAQFIFGPDSKGDEGAGAHLWQLFMAAQILAIAFFLFKWLPKAPGQALAVLGVQVLAVLAAISPVWWFKL